MPEVLLRPAGVEEKDSFTSHFQDYLRELSRLNGALPNRHGVFEYGLYDMYWRDERFMPFFIECDGRCAGLLLLRELPEHESPDRRDSLQVAEIYVFKPHRRRAIGTQAMRLAAAMAEERGKPLTWSAYINNRPANDLYRLVLDEFGGKDGAWATKRTSGIDQSGLARFYYKMAPAGAAESDRMRGFAV